MKEMMEKKKEGMSDKDKKKAMLIMVLRKRMGKKDK